VVAADREPLPSAHFQRTALHHVVDILEKQQGVLVAGLEIESAILRPLLRTEAAVNKAVAALHQLASEEGWTAVMFRQIQTPADCLIETAGGVQLDAAIINWVTRVHSLMPDVVRCAEEVLKEKSADYTIKELGYEIQKFGKYCTARIWSSSFSRPGLLTLPGNLV
jgi:hypothetical protein